MTIELRSWPFALRRLCGKWYALALVSFAAAVAVIYAIVRNDVSFAIWPVFGILLLYGGAVVIASHRGAHERLDPLGCSLTEIRSGRIPILCELRRYCVLTTFALLSPLILIAGLAFVPRVLFALGVDSEVWVGALTILAPNLLLIVALYTIFRWETSRNWRHDTAKRAPRALYLRSFSEEATLVVGGLLRSRLSRWIESALGRMFSVERLVFRALIERRLAGIAVGAPGERLPPLGFARLYFSDQEWQRKVAALISECRVIIVNCSMTKWVQWELEEVERQSARCKLMLMAHGRTAEERVGKFNFALQALGIDRALDVGDAANTIILARLDQSEPLEIRAFPDDLFAFLDAVTLSVYVLDARSSDHGHLAQQADARCK